MTIDHSRLTELFDYCPITGEFTRKVSMGKFPAGSVAGSPSRGYIEVTVDGRAIRGHRLAWFYVHKTWPSGNLDHRDLNRANNAITNLREATQSQNGGNNKLSPRSSTGYKGVTYCKKSKKYVAALMKDRKRVFLGHFSCPARAAEAYDDGALLHFGKFALTNRELGLI